MPTLTLKASAFQLPAPDPNGPREHEFSRWRVRQGSPLGTVIYDSYWIADLDEHTTPDLFAPDVQYYAQVKFREDIFGSESEWSEPVLSLVSSCNSGWRITIFERDDITPIFGSVNAETGRVLLGGFHTSRSCPRPFMKWPRDISETEINAQEGRTIIGAMTVELLDKRRVADDQDTGIITSIIDKLDDARAVVEAYYNNGWQVVMDGAIQSFRLAPSLVAYELSIRDIREREREFRLFHVNDTWAVFPDRGSANGYGKETGGGEPLMPPAGVLTGVYTEQLDSVYRRQGYVSSTMFFEDLDEDIRTMGEPSYDQTGLVPVAKYPLLTVRWRPTSSAASDCPGSPSTDRVQNMLDTAPPEELAKLQAAYSAANSGNSMPSNPNTLTKAAMGGNDCKATTAKGVKLKNLFLLMVDNYGGEFDDWVYLSDATMPGILGAGNFFVAGNIDIFNPGSLGLPTSWVPKVERVRVLLEGPAEDMPAPGQSIEVQVLARQTSDATPLVWEGSFGRLLRLIYDGFFSDKAPRIRYNEERMAWLEANTPMARLKIKKPVDDMRRWVEEHIYKVLGMVPLINEEGEILPTDVSTRPEAGTVLPVLNNSNVATDAQWEAGSEGAISEVEFIYWREYRTPVVTIEEVREKKKFLGIDSLRKDKIIKVENVSFVVSEREVRQVFTQGPGVAGKKISYKPDTVRVLGTVGGQPVTGDTMDESGAQLAAARAHFAMSRFLELTPRINVRVRQSSPAAALIKIGGWVRLNVSWLPDPTTKVRGCDRICQVVARRPPADDGWLHFRLIDGGPFAADAPATNLIVDPAPYFDTDNLPTVEVTDVPVGYTGRIEMAMSITGAPGATDPAWQVLSGEVIAPGVYKSPIPIPTDIPVWVRWRVEVLGQQPGPWSDPVEVTGTVTTPTVLHSNVDIDFDTGEVTVNWQTGSLIEGVRIYYDIHEEGDDPVLDGPFVELAAGDATTVLPEEVPLGVTPYMATIRLEPWSNFPVDEMTGEKGTDQRRSARYPGTGELPTTEESVDEQITEAKLFNIVTRNGPTYILAAEDRNWYLRLAHPTAMSLIVPPNATVPFPIGTEIYVERSDVGRVKIEAGAGVTIRSEGNKYHLADIWAVGALVKVGPDEWTFRGNRIRDELILIPDTATLEIMGYAPEVNIGMIISPEGAMMQITGYAPTMAMLLLVAGTAACEITGYAPNLSSEPEIRATQTGTDVDASNTHQAPLPAGVQVGDLLMVFIQNSAFNQAVPAVPAGWNSMDYRGYTGGAAWAATFIVYGRIADGTEGASLSFAVPGGLATTNSVTLAIAIKAGTFDPAGFSWNTFDDWYHSEIDPVNSANPDTPNAAPGWSTDNKNTLWISVAWLADNVAVTGYPANYTGGVATPYVQPSAGFYLGIAAASRRLTAVSENPGAFTRAAGRWFGQTWAIRGRSS